MNPSATLNGQDRFLAALLQSATASAWSAFEDALLARPVRPWLRALAMAALKREQAGSDAVEHALETARIDQPARLALFARIAASHGGLETATAAARRSIEAAPDRAEMSFLLCSLLLRAGHADANAILAHCLAQFPDEGAGWLAVAETLADLGKTDAALASAERAARSSGASALCLRRGLLLRSLGRLGEARLAFAEATATDHNAKRAWFLLGLCAQDERDLDGAASAYRTALSIDPSLAEAALNLGTVLQEQGSLDAAKACYGQAITSRPDTFGRVAQALTTAPKGELWFDLGALRQALAG